MCLPFDVSVVLLILPKSDVRKTSARMVTGLLQAIHIQTWLESTLRSIGPASSVDRCEIEFLDCKTPTSVILFDDIKTVF